MPVTSRPVTKQPLCDMRPDTIRRAAEKFSDLVQRIPPIGQHEVDQVLEDWPIDPRDADHEKAWSAIWTKPLYAKASTAAADGWISQISRFAEPGWRSWGIDREAFFIEKVGSYSREEDFRGFGRDLEELREVSRVPVFRLYGIQSAACAFRRRAARSERPVRDFASTPLDTLVPRLEEEFGWGWGATTVTHMLADFGVAVKTDRHVMRSLRALGIWKSPADELKPHEVLEANRGLRTLLLALGEITPKNLRRLDIQLMVLSKHGVLPES